MKLTTPEGAVKPELHAAILKTQTAVIEQHVRDFEIPHDGFRCAEEHIGFFAEDSTKPVTLSIALNVHCKDEDFDAFDTMLQGQLYSVGAMGAMSAVIANYLAHRQFPITQLKVSVQPSGFGYG